jgi:hypothetical protein
MTILYHDADVTGQYDWRMIESTYASLIKETIRQSRVYAWYTVTA